MSEIKYRYWLEPIGGPANEAIADQINKLGDSAYLGEDQSIWVDDVQVTGAYLVPHSMLTRVGHSEHKIKSGLTSRLAKVRFDLTLTTKKSAAALTRPKLPEKFVELSTCFLNAKLLATTKTIISRATAVSLFNIFTTSVITLIFLPVLYKQALTVFGDNHFLFISPLQLTHEFDWQCNLHTPARILQ